MEELAGQEHPQLWQMWQQVGEKIILVYQQWKVIFEVLSEMKREDDCDDRESDVSFPKLNLQQGKNRKK